MNYRKLYEKVYGVKLKDEYEVHHIDYNHNNDDPDNLVALPKELHRRLHKAYNEFKLMRDKYTIEDIYVHSGAINGRLAFFEALKTYMSVIDECVFYMNERERMYWRKYYAE